MNEFLIKLKSMLTGSGFQDAENQLKRVKAAADDANRASAKVGRTPAGTSPASPGKAFTADESKAMAATWMKEAMADAEKARASLDKVAESATKTKKSLEGGGSAGGGGGGFLSGITRVAGLATAGIVVGKIMSSQVDKLSEGVKGATENTRALTKGFGDLAGAATFGEAVSQFGQLSGLADNTEASLAKLNSQWGPWTANLLTFGAAFRDMQAAADQQRSVALSGLSAAMYQQAANAEELAADPTNAGRTDDIKRRQEREAERRKAQELIARQKKPADKAQAVIAASALEERYAAEDVALAKIVAAKQEALQLDLQLKQARRDGNIQEEARLKWVIAYNDALKQGQAAKMADPYAFARDTANQTMPGAAENTKIFEETQAAIEKARQEGLAREAEAAAADAAKASKREELDLELQIAEAKASGNDGEVKKLEWMREYTKLLKEAQASGMGDNSYGFATRGANAATTDKAGKPTKPTIERDVFSAMRAIGGARGENYSTQNEILKEARATNQKLQKLIDKQLEERPAGATWQ
jgi:hypothetical protein